MQIIFESPFEFTANQREKIKAALHSPSLIDAANIIRKTRGIAPYIGGHHIAIHPGNRGIIVHGSDRIAIIVETRHGGTNGDGKE
ncbi:MAG: hypothetical protein WC484_06540 [Candidatus Omnitrophota bacterium]